MSRARFARSTAPDLEWIAGLAGGGWHLGRRVSKICLQFLLTSCHAEPGVVCSDCTREADRLGLTIPPLPAPLEDEPYWRKSFTVTPPPGGLEGGLAETAVVVQAKHGGPVPLTREQAEEFIDALQVAIEAGEDE